MIDPISRSQSVRGSAPLPPAASPANSADSFSDRLARVLGGQPALESVSGHARTNADSVTRPESGARQIVAEPAPAAQPGRFPPESRRQPEETAPKAAAEPVYTLMGIPRPAVSAPPAVAPQEPGRRLASGKLVTNEYEAYWASQPPEVQQLMDIPSEEARAAKAVELADKGYLIDVPIMLWGWDPLTTMMVRQSQGYTWVPSAKMAPVSVAPGLSFPGKTSYDPKNPPPGAILVTTEFAKGLEHTCPWLRAEIPS